MTSRGIRNNNPGNIRHSRTVYQGQSPGQPDASFVTFLGPEWGIRAMAKILLTYESTDGVRTLRQAIARWAPGADHNDVEAYVKDVAQRADVDPDHGLNLRDAAVMIPVLQGMVRHENGSQPYPLCTFVKAVQLAGLVVKSVAAAAAPAIAGAPVRPAGFNPGD